MSIMKKLLVLGAIAFGLNAFGQVPSYVPANGLVGWWSFDGNANDESGNGNNATPMNGAFLTTDRFGNSNMAYGFDGLDDHLTGTFTNFPIGSSARSVTGWMNLTDTASWYLNFLASWGLDDGTFGSQNKAFGLFVNDELTESQVWVSWGASQNFSYPFIAGNWYFMCVSIDQFQIASLYINGQLVGDVFLDGMNTIANNNIFHLGKSSHVPSFGWEGYTTGSLDDIGIWDRELTYCEIQDLYNAQLNSSPAIDAGTDQVFCNSGVVTLNGSGGSNYQWSGGVTNGVPFSVSSTQSFTLIGEDALGCLGTDVVTVTIQSNVASTQVVNACESYTWIDGNTYTASTNTPAWMLSTTAGCDSLVTLNLTVNNSSSSSITATAVNSYTAPSGAIFTTSGVYTDIIPNAVGCDSIITINLTVSALGIDEHELDAIHVYPNPTSDFLSIQFNEDVSESYIQLIDALGRIVLVTKVQAKEIKLDVSKLEPGVYYINIDGVRPVPFVKQ